MTGDRLAVRGEDGVGDAPLSATVVREEIYAKPQDSM